VFREERDIIIHGIGDKIGLRREGRVGGTLWKVMAVGIDNVGCNGGKSAYGKATYTMCLWGSLS